LGDDPDSANITSKTSSAAVNEALAGREKRAAWLVVLAGANVGETHKLEGGDLVLGRGMNANIRLRDDGVSRRHAKLLLADGEVVVEDLGSANGTLVNGELVTRRVLVDGDKIRLGAGTILRFGYHDKVEERFQQQMYDAALRDGLTHAFNKRYFLDRLDAEFAFAERHASTLSVLMFDVDHFKRVNDTHGHLAGDAVLARLAEIARGCIRAEDVFARWGGEEFVILCRGIPLANAAILAERLRSRVEAATFEHAGHVMKVTISVGLAGLPDPRVARPLDLVGAADEALYRAKNAGRNRVTTA
jgi:diguanylate cyclase (GGDEF)-like protein